MQKGARVGEQALFQTAEKNQRKFQAFGRVQRHQSDLGAFVVGIGIAHQGGMVEKLVERLAAIAGVHGGVDQFVQVLDSRVGFGRVFFFEQFDVAGAVDQELQDVGSGRRVANPRTVRARILRAAEPGRSRSAARLEVWSSASALRNQNSSASKAMGSNAICSVEFCRRRRIVRGRGRFRVPCAPSMLLGVGSRQHGSGIFDQIVKLFSAASARCGRS